MKQMKSFLEHTNLTLVFSFFDIVNLTIAVSFLVIPYWFFHAGLLLGIVSLSLSLGLGAIASFWVLEVLARASFLQRNEDYSCINNRQDEIVPEIDPDRKFELNELSKITMSNISGSVVSSVVILSGILMIFDGIIPGSQALAVNIPINTTIFAACDSSEFDVGFLPEEISCVNWYRLMVGVFGLIGTLLSCLRGKEQIYVIVILSIIRIVVMCYMMGFSIFVMSEDRKGNNSIETAFVTKFEFTQGMLATAAFFSMLILPSLVPSVVHPIRNKSRLRPLIIVTFVLLTILLSLYGIILSFAFGHSIHPNSILNLQPYTTDEYSWFVRVISHIILIYPCIDGISGYIYGVTLASNLTFTILTGKDFSELSIKRKFKLLNFLIYLGYSIVPTVVCLFISNLSIILNSSGLVVFISNIIIPSFLQIFSNKKCRKLLNIVPESGSIRRKLFNKMFKASFPTPDSSFYSSTFMVVSITLTSSIIFVLTFYFLIEYILSA